MPFFGDSMVNPELPQWLTMSLLSLNLFSTFICVVNMVYLCKRLPPGNQLYMYEELEIENRRRASQIPTKADQNIQIRQSSIDIPNESLQSSIDYPATNERCSADMSKLFRYKNYVKRYFYLMCVVPIMTGYLSHYGATFPKQGIWIFPFINFVIAIGFIGFIQLMIKSCDGWNEIRKRLEPQNDRICPAMNMNDNQHNEPLLMHQPEKCCGCMGRLLLKENLYLGFRFRLQFAYLIVIKPLLAYMLTYFMYYGDYDIENVFSWVLKVLTLITTIIPMQSMKIFHHTIEKYSRIKRTGIKMIFIIILAPLVQLQETVVQFLFTFGIIDPFKHVKKDLRWCAVYGTLLCFEMTFITTLITWWAFNPRDLFDWHSKVEKVSVMSVSGAGGCDETEKEVAVSL